MMKNNEPNMNISQGWRKPVFNYAECKNLNIPFISAQHEYSLLARGVERELIPLLENQDKALLPWSPLGRGVLTAKYRFGTPVDSRAASKHFSSFIQDKFSIALQP